MDVREKLVEVLKKCGVCNIYAVVQLANALAANGVTVHEWISVKDRLPEDLPENKGKKVINCIVAHSPYANGKLTSQFRQRKLDNWDNKWYWSKIGGCTVTHWMPLPQPPKGE